ncbi:type II toxin-antitoxin system mRNA interferase toxin, RelE/StbE family [Candidatus Nomurabacteria bacterium]|nr:type II toxin-antitoxin system mRNA interferase toxin, RelE/StbE family [Candidatus Nomurabacteria bacterium]
MLEVFFSAKFIKQFGKLEVDLQDEVLEKVELFRIKNNHQTLKAHKLKGELKNYFSFSVNYKIRIIFKKEKDKYYLLTISDHDIYK